VLGGLLVVEQEEGCRRRQVLHRHANKVFSIPDDQIREVRIQKTGADALVLKRDDSKKWSIAAPKAYPADQDAAGQVGTTLTGLNADKVIEEKAADLSPYGLNAPTMTVTVLRKDGKTDTLLFGDETPTGSGSYAKTAADAKVFTVASYNKSSLEKTANDLRDKRLLTFDSDKLTRVELTAKGPAIEFGKNNQNDWQILSSRPLRADGSQVEDLRRLKDADGCGATDEDEEAAPRPPGRATAVVADLSGARLSKSARTRTRTTTPGARWRAAQGRRDLGDGLTRRWTTSQQEGSTSVSATRPVERNGHVRRAGTRDVGREDDGCATVGTDRQAARSPATLRTARASRPSKPPSLRTTASVRGSR
jgi:hypothetical protein